MRALVVLAVLSACSTKSTTRELDHNLVHVTNDARLRTDEIGGGKWVEQATFVLVEAENTAKEGAYVTLAGELTDAAGTKVGDLKPQSLWVPAGDKRTFALVDRERKPRPTAKGAHIYVRGARISPPPQAHIIDDRQVADGDKMVVQGTLTNDAARGSNIMVVATFYAPDGRPMTRPFSVLWVEPKGSLPVQFVGPPGSTRGDLFVGDAVY